MFQPERKSSAAAPLPPSAADPAAGIASIPQGFVPREALAMPAASFSEECPAQPQRQCEIGSKQCRWIVADEDAGAEALMCAAPVEPHRPFCAAHCARAYMKPPEDEAAIEEAAAPEEETEEDDDDDDDAEMTPDEIESRAECTRRAILDLLASGEALTADTLAERLDLPILYVRPRVSELVSQQRVVASGQRAPNASGKLANKWTVA